MARAMSLGAPVLNENNSLIIWPDSFFHIVLVQLLGKFRETMMENLEASLIVPGRLEFIFNVQIIYVGPRLIMCATRSSGDRIK